MLIDAVGVARTGVHGLYGVDHAVVTVCDAVMRVGQVDGCFPSVLSGVCDERSVIDMHRTLSLFLAGLGFPGHTGIKAWMMGHCQGGSLASV